MGLFLIFTSIVPAIASLCGVLPANIEWPQTLLSISYALQIFIWSLLKFQLLKLEEKESNLERIGRLFSLLSNIFFNLLGSTLLFGYIGDFIQDKNIVNQSGLNFALLLFGVSWLGPIWYIFKTRKSEHQTPKYTFPKDLGLKYLLILAVLIPFILEPCLEIINELDFGCQNIKDVFVVKYSPASYLIFSPKLIVKDINGNEYILKNISNDPIEKYNPGTKIQIIEKPGALFKQWYAEKDFYQIKMDSIEASFVLNIVFSSILIFGVFYLERYCLPNKSYFFLIFVQITLSLVIFYAI